MDLPRCSIIIPLFNRADLTRGCLETLIEHTPSDLYEVVLVDNGSTDGTGELLTQLDGELVIIRNEKNLGFAAACNQGAEAASTGLLLFLNNDTRLLPGWLEPLLAASVDFPEVGAVGAKLLYPNGTIQHAGIVLIYNSFLGIFGGSNHLAGESSDLPVANEAQYYQAVTGAVMLVRREAFDQVSGFDTGYWNGNEDVDICLKLGKQGWKILYQPASTVIHLESQSGDERIIKFDENNELLKRRWLQEVVPDVVLISGKELVKVGSYPWKTANPIS